MTTGTIQVGDGCRIAYRLDGREGAPLLMLANSLGARLSMWDAQIAAFSARFRVLRYDARGHGASDVPAGPYSIDRLGRDAVELLDGLGFEQVFFCGLSMGGMVGQWLGYRAPERLRALILANTSACMPPASLWQERLETVRARGVAALVDGTMERWFTADFRARSPDAVRPIRETMLTIDPQGYASCCAAIRDMDLRRTDTLIAARTLVIAGRHDTSAPPAQAEQIHQAIRGSRLVMLESAHLSNIERAAEFNDAVLGFLAEQGPSLNP